MAFNDTCFKIEQVELNVGVPSAKQCLTMYLYIYICEKGSTALEVREHVENDGA